MTATPLANESPVRGRNLSVANNSLPALPKGAIALAPMPLEIPTSKRRVASGSAGRAGRARCEDDPRGAAVRSCWRLRGDRSARFPPACGSKAAAQLFAPVFRDERQVGWPRQRWSSSLPDCGCPCIDAARLLGAAPRASVLAASYAAKKKPPRGGGFFATGRATGYLFLPLPLPFVPEPLEASN